MMQVIKEEPMNVESTDGREVKPKATREGFKISNNKIKGSKEQNIGRKAERIWSASAMGASIARRKLKDKYRRRKSEMDKLETIVNKISIAMESKRTTKIKNFETALPKGITEARSMINEKQMINGADKRHIKKKKRKEDMKSGDCIIQCKQGVSLDNFCLSQKVADQLKGFVKLRVTDNQRNNNITWNSKLGTRKVWSLNVADA